MGTAIVPSLFQIHDQSYPYSLPIPWSKYTTHFCACNNTAAELYACFFIILDFSQISRLPHGVREQFFFHKRSKLKIKYFFGVGNFCMTCNFVRCIHGYLENRLTSIHGYLENRLNSAVWEGVNPFQLLVFFVMLKSSQKNQGALK